MTRGNGKVRGGCQQWICKRSKPGTDQPTLSGIREESPETKPDQPHLSGIREAQEVKTWIRGLSHHYIIQAIPLYFNREKVRRGEMGES